MSQIDLQSVVYRDGEHYVAQCLNVDVSSFGDSEAEALVNLREALELYFEDAPAGAEPPTQCGQRVRVAAYGSFRSTTLDHVDAHARQVPEAARTMSEPRVYGHTRSGRPITDTDVEALAAEAEAGYDVDELIARRPKRGRPALSASPANVESVRLDPELRRELLDRARTDATTTSEVIREALRRFLRAA
jgi:predicted RNase H-like HicB family nuclease